MDGQAVGDWATVTKTIHQGRCFHLPKWSHHKGPSMLSKLIGRDSNIFVPWADAFVAKTIGIAGIVITLGKAIYRKEIGEQILLGNGTWSWC